MVHSMRRGFPIGFVVPGLRVYGRRGGEAHELAHHEKGRQVGKRAEDQLIKDHHLGSGNPALHVKRAGVNCDPPRLIIVLSTTRKAAALAAGRTWAESTAVVSPSTRGAISTSTLYWTKPTITTPKPPNRLQTPQKHSATRVSSRTGTRSGRWAVTCF